MTVFSEKQARQLDLKLAPTQEALPHFGLKQLTCPIVIDFAQSHQHTTI
jgi:hypothetical protein